MLSRRYAAVTFIISLTEQATEKNQMIVTLCVRGFAVSEHNYGVTQQAMKTIECGSSVS